MTASAVPLPVWFRLIAALAVRFPVMTLKTIALPENDPVWVRLTTALAVADPP